MEKNLDNIINKKETLLKDIKLKKETLNQEEIKKEDIDNELYQLDYDLLRLKNKKQFIQNIPKILNKEKKNIISKEIITFFIISLIIAGVSIVTIFTSLHTLVIPFIITALGLDALGCTVNGIIDFNSYKNELKSYDLDKLEEEIIIVTNKINNKKNEKIEIQNNIKILKEEILMLINEKETLSSKLFNIKDVYNNLLNEYGIQEDSKVEKTLKK